MKQALGVPNGFPTGGGFRYTLRLQQVRKGTRGIDVPARECKR
jgi:hypothetical protein